jgi:hypothetical protein
MNNYLSSAVTLCAMLSALCELLIEAGRGWEAEIELGVARITGIGRFCLRIFGGEITPIGAK